MIRKLYSKVIARRVIKRAAPHIRPVKIVKLRHGVTYTNIYGDDQFIGTDELAQARKAVKRGAALLDRKLPGWVDILVPEALELASCEMCVCGQLGYATKDPAYKKIALNHSDPFAAMVDYLGLDDWGDNTEGHTSRHYGFDSDPSVTYEALEVEWHRVVTRRRRAAARAKAQAAA